MNGRGFDGIALDIEGTDVADITLRNNRLVQLTQRVRKLVGNDMPLGAIVYPAVQLELLNLTLWPDFPYQRLAPSIDVWMPMVYFTFRSVESGYRDPVKYTDGQREPIAQRPRRPARHRARDRRHRRSRRPPTTTRRSGAPSTQRKAIGYSVYDYNTTSSSAWPWLRRG